MSCFDLGLLLTHAGTRVARLCDGTSSYYKSLDECLPAEIAGTQEFIDAFQSQWICPGGVIADGAALERLRYCQVINGSLEITISDLTADFSVLYDISRIDGLFFF